MKMFKYIAVLLMAFVAVCIISLHAYHHIFTLAVLAVLFAMTSSKDSYDERRDNKCS